MYALNKIIRRLFAVTETLCLFRSEYLFRMSVCTAAPVVYIMCLFKILLVAFEMQHTDGQTDVPSLMNC
jgi:hypothetical protein